MIAIIDYGMGNVKSMFNALKYLGEEVIITSNPEEIDKSTHIILPGVGAFGDAMINLKKRKLVEVIKEQVLVKKKPFLGVCLGMQLLAKESEEHGIHQGLGLFDAKIVKFNLDPNEYKIPHMGWNDVKPRIKHSIFENLKDNEFTFYFVHSYHIICKNENDIIATCDYEITFPAIIAKDNIVATQFHPEKSQDNGIQMLENFVNWRP